MYLDRDMVAVRWYDLVLDCILNGKMFEDLARTCILSNKLKLSFL